MPAQQTITRQHAEWLSLIEISGPFVSLPVLQETFPDGLDLREDDVETRRRLRLAYEEWADNQGGAHPDPAIHYQWLHFVLEEILQMEPRTILEGPQIPASICYEHKENGMLLRPTLVIRSPFEPKPRLLVQLYPTQQNLEKSVAESTWKATPAARMMELLRATGTRLGLVTNGEQWMLVDAPANEPTGYYSWYASLWLEEPMTLRAFYSLLGMQRFFGVRDDQTIEALLTQSADKQQEVTTQLGDQVRRAVEVLVQTLDRIDKDSQRTLLKDITETELYEAALTVMMRLVFLLSAEERKLLLLDDPIYDSNYAVSTLQKQLQEQADQHGEEVLGLRYDAWSRLLAIFRAVFGGVDYPDLQLPAYGGHLFDPDRFPFLEGRATGTSWRDVQAHPLRIDNRTVLYLLKALQYLQIKVGTIVEARRLSFRSLDIEQIGHVYEGLLDHTVKRAERALLGLQGTSDTEPEATLDELEHEASKGEKAFLDYLHTLTGRSAVTLKKSLAVVLEKRTERSRLMEACDNKQDIFQRILPFVGLLRRDTFNNFVIVAPGSVYMTKGTDRRSTGTHYTPRSLTEPIVKHALDPLVYVGPAEGWPEEQWQLRSAAEILNLTVCDIAMGSGAFLVQTCRYLSEKLVEAWENVDLTLHGKSLTSKPQKAPEGGLSQGGISEEIIPIDREERLIMARRLVSERCIYGVDKNPMAVEMAKLSMWLITLAKGRPFTFLDHALRCGDSLLGVSDRQLANWSLDAKSGEIGKTVWGLRDQIRRNLDTAIILRKQIISSPNIDIHDTEKKERSLKKAEEVTRILNLGADLLIGIALSDPKRQQALQDTLTLEYSILTKAYEEAIHEGHKEASWAAKRDAFDKLRKEVDELLTYNGQYRRPFHWHLEFPEVFVGKEDDAGFAAIVGNPPFLGSKMITGTLGTDYREYLIEYIAQGKRRARADLCAFFFLRACTQVRRNGQCAFLATNTIAQGDTREIGLEQIAREGWTIPRAIPSQKWPGEAALEVAQVWLKNGKWQGRCVLNDKVVNNITPFLTTSGKTQGNPYRLLSNSNKSFQGSVILGMGFTLEPEKAQALIKKDAQNANILFPYINGEDLNTHPDQSPSRWVINFHDWPLEYAEAYSDCIEIVREKVKPDRDRLGLKTDSSAKGYAKLWWQFARKGLDLYSTIADMERVLTIPFTSKYKPCVWLPNGMIYSNALNIIALTTDADFAILQCTHHDVWARAHGSSMRNDQRYTPTDCFETFPFPPTSQTLDNIGERYYTHRQSIMLARQEGLTQTYNRFHNPDESSSDIVQLRALHKEMDEAVAHAYGWDDLALEHGFHETKQGLRYTISEAARREVLDRLLLLNHQRHAEEEKAGLTTKGGKGKSTKGKRSTPASKAAQNGQHSNATNNDSTLQSTLF